MLRVFLPVFREPDELIKWSEFYPLHDQASSIDWKWIVEQVKDDQPSILDYAPATGELDEKTREALLDAVGTIEMNALHWLGYGDRLQARHPQSVFDADYRSSKIMTSDLLIEQRIPEFAWDDVGEFAWGARLYADSFVIAGTTDIVKKLHTDPRVDTICVRKHIDVIPRSAGD